jgi:quercetin dioxygenase-like cupin family protein
MITTIVNEHASPYETMLQVIEGTIDVIVGGTSNLIKAGEYVQLPAEFSHTLQAKEKTKILLIMMK